MRYRMLKTAIGELLLAGKSDALAVIGLPCGKGAVLPEPSWQEDESAFVEAARQLTEYFEGSRQTFDLELEPEGTEFQKKVWWALDGIPFGETISYGELAERIGRPGASRAVGAANGRNPLPIVLPCHRVIGSDGSLTGYGGGLETKKFLLELEGAGEAQLTLAT